MQKPRILLIDDSHAFRILFKKMMEAAYPDVEVSDGSAYPGDRAVLKYDALVIDEHLGDGDSGFRHLERLHANGHWMDLGMMLLTGMPLGSMDHALGAAHYCCYKMHDAGWIYSMRALLRVVELIRMGR